MQGALRVAGDAHQDELQRLGDGEPDLADELAGVGLQRQDGVGGGADEVRLGRGRARERSLREQLAQQPAEQQLERAADQAVVRLEHRPGQLGQHRPLDQRHHAAHVELAPGGVPRQRPRARQPDAVGAHQVDVDAALVQHRVAGRIDPVGDVDRAGDRARSPDRAAPRTRSSVRAMIPAANADGFTVTSGDPALASGARSHGW